MFKLVSSLFPFTIAHKIRKKITRQTFTSTIFTHKIYKHKLLNVSHYESPKQHNQQQGKRSKKECPVFVCINILCVDEMLLHENCVVIKRK